MKALRWILLVSFTAVALPCLAPGRAMAEEAAEPVLTVEEWVKSKGLKVNENDRVGRTLAYFAAEEGRVDVLEWLKEQGADVNAKRDGGATPIHRATMYGHINVVKWLMEQGVDVNVRGRHSHAQRGANG